MALVPSVARRPGVALRPLKQQVFRTVSAVVRNRAKRRLRAATAGMVVLFLLLSARVVQVQGLSADRYSAFGESQRVLHHVREIA